MRITFGNDNAIEGYRDPQGADPEQVLYRDHPGQWETRLEYPPDITLLEAFSATVEAMSHHMKPHARPAWIEGDNPNLVDMLCEHYAIDPEVDTKPPSWGQSNGE